MLVFEVLVVELAKVKVEAISDIWANNSAKSLNYIE